MFTLDHAPFCSQLACQKKQAIVGSIGYKPLQIFLELAQPWASQLMLSPTFPQGLEGLIKKVQREQKLAVSLNAIAPDPSYSVPGLRRLIVLRQEPNIIAPYHKWEGLVPDAALGESLHLLLHGKTLKVKDSASYQLEQWVLSGHQDIRHAMVCCHKSRDRCCGLYGQSLYEYLRSHPQLGGKPDTTAWQVWQCSHIGGHKYAPTFLELPSMRAWGHVSTSEAEGILLRQIHLAHLHTKYRGYAGLAHAYEQAAEWEAFKEKGWSWLSKRELGLNSSWSASSLPPQGVVHFPPLDYGNEQPLAYEVQQTGKIESEASCYSLEKKAHPLFFCRKV